MPSADSVARELAPAGLRSGPKKQQRNISQTEEANWQPVFRKNPLPVFQTADFVRAGNQHPRIIRAAFCHQDS
jgi:hypothetical protein